MGTSHFDPDRFHITNRPRCTRFLEHYLRNREYGFRPEFGDQDQLHCDMYSSLYPIAKWKNDLPTVDRFYTGRVMNLEFSPDGKILAAALCEQRNFMLFDPLTQKHIASTKESHNGHLSCIKFLDSRIFATCGNNSTIALWDVRSLKENVRVLEGHKYWVNSIEYSEKDNLLVSSSYDGCIHTWDINRYWEGGSANEPICRINELKQIKLLPDSSKLVACMENGFILLIKNLDLKTLGTDMHEFKPCMYRMMQLSGIPLHQAVANTHMFLRKRNRIEFVVDFPRHFSTGKISSMQLHPQGWNVLSRSFTTYESSEWTCVHDIQELAVSSAIDEHKEVFLGEEEPSWEHNSLGRRQRYIKDLWVAVMNETRTQTEQESGTNSMDVSTVGGIDKVPPNYKIHMNSKRLTHFVEEDEDNRFVKEACYSNDGRVICSPLGRGVRLLSFTPSCEELSTLLPNPPGIKLNVISVIRCHSDIVVCAKFSPVHPLLVSGSLNGQIVFYQPRF